MIQSPGIFHGRVIAPYLRAGLCSETANADTTILREVVAYFRRLLSATWAR